MKINHCGYLVFFDITEIINIQKARPPKICIGAAIISLMIHK